MTIISAVYEDIPEVMRMSKTFYPLTRYELLAELDESSVEDLIRALVDSHILLLARRNDKIVGLIGAFVLPWMFNRNVLTAHEVIWWVDVDERRGSIGMDLKEACEEQAKTLGAVALQMPHFTDIPEAGKLYERSGYEHTESIYLKRF